MLNNIEYDTKKIIFTGVTNQNSQDNSVKLTVKEFEFENQGEKSKITKVNFIGFPKVEDIDKSSLESIFSKGNFVLNFDDEKVEINVIKKNVNVNVATFLKASSGDSSQDNQKPRITINENNDSLTIQVKSGVIEITEQVEDDKEKLINDSIEEIKTKLQAKDITSEKTVEILAENWETNYRTDWKLLDKEEIKRKKQEAIDKITNFFSDDENNEDQLTPCQKKFKEVQTKMTNKKISEGDFDDETKIIYNKLKSNEFSEESELNTNWGKVNKIVCEKGAEKGLNDLTTRINKAITDNKEEKLKTLKTEIDSFINDKDNESKKSAAQELSARLSKKIDENTQDGAGKDIPWRVIIPVSLIILIILGAIIYTRQNKEDE
ncbi:MAG: hypothetical protein mread185_000369 [Mycoplasmataceae bacterium]|nr:MAG: hypothetical protein mread185_000369 [Mycoplasmataceae bacterium]